MKFHENYYPVAYFLIALVMLFLLTSCADVVNVDECLPPPVEATTYGFFSGAWHGSIMPISIIGRILSDDIAVYAINNIGSWYDAGFVLGLNGVIVFIGLFFDLVAYIFKR